MTPSPTLYSWLNDPTSFMKRAQAHGLNPQIKLLKEQWLYPNNEERQLLKLPFRRYAFLREVLIHHNETPLIYAQTLIPKATLRGSARELLHLGTKALGAFLFAQADLDRSPFELKQVQVPTYSSSPLWARRSLFSFAGKELLLSEVFLPGLVDLL